MQNFEKTLEEIHILTDRYVLFGEICPFPAGKTVELDLGCGKGGFSAALSAKYPERLILAADIMLGRMRRVKKKTDRTGNGNVCCLRTEARFLLGISLPDQCIDRIHILCPDPWPKDRHRGHRLLCSDFMMQINRVLKEGGIFHFSTDDPEYLKTVTDLVKTSGLFEPAGPDALADVSGEEFRTEFERDWLSQGKAVPHLAWRTLKPVFTGAH